MLFKFLCFFLCSFFLLSIVFISLGFLVMIFLEIFFWRIVIVMGRMICVIVGKNFKIFSFVCWRKYGWIILCNWGSVFLFRIVNFLFSFLVFWDLLMNCSKLKSFCLLFCRGVFVNRSLKGMCRVWRVWYSKFLLFLRCWFLFIMRLVYCIEENLILVWGFWVELYDIMIMWVFIFFELFGNSLYL